MRELERSITCAELTDWYAYQILALEERSQSAEQGFYDPTFWD